MVPRDKSLCFSLNPGLEKVPISLCLVTLLHNYGVIPTPQSPILLENLRQYHRKLCVSANVSTPSADVSASNADIVALNGECSSVSWCFTSGSRCFHVCFTMYHNVLQVFHDVLLFFTMFSKSRNDRHRCIGDCATGDCLRDHDNAAGIDTNSAEIGDIAAKVIPCLTLSWIERD